MRKQSLKLLFFVFTLSGFSGLIYESIWTHYLKLFLGHAAYAQSLVLAIFMGGLALGSWLCSRYSSRWGSLLTGYALAEALIGLLALAFHSIFEQSIQLSYTSVLPHLGSPQVAYAYKWLLSALLILPQSILLGMTFPLMSAGILRLSPQTPGRTISLLYFTNSLGAAVGVLASGFWLIRLVGLPWTLRIAGLVNLALALTVWYLVGDREAAKAKPAVSEVDVPAASERGRYRFLLAVALITGSSSFIYEIGWIRMLSLVMGSSTHAFELMLSAFILGLACGGLWIQRVIDRIELPERYLALVQVAMGLLALSTLLLYGQTFNVMKALLQSVPKTEAGYFTFNLASNAIALGIMLPTTFCAGMTLPLITVTLLRRKQGERSIGAVYAANTLGAILGVFFATHVGLPALGLKGLIAFGAACDLGLGLLLLWRYAGYTTLRPLLLASAAGVAALAVVLLGVTFDPYKLASGVYRTGMFLYPQLTEITSHVDGKTATISTYVERTTGTVAIATNGKSDAALVLELNRPATPDEPTMILAGTLPMAFNPSARTAANIGLGSGLTSQTLLGNPRLTQVDSIEIEQAVVDAGRFFLPRVPAVYGDPRSRIYVDDAKTFFSVHQKRYDIIVSEPSNPWVSGVAGLFSEEFYAQINLHLAPEGVFAQWVQLYEIDNELVLSILKAVSNQFSDYAVYSTNERDMIIVAKKEGLLPALDPGVLTLPQVASALARVEIRNLQDLQLRKLGNKRLFKRLLASPSIQANSDYLPFVDQNAARARFLEANANDVPGLTQGTGPLMELLAGDTLDWGSTDITLSPLLLRSQAENRAMALRDYCLQGRFDPRYEAVLPEIRTLAVELVAAARDGQPESDGVARQISLYNGLSAMVPYLKARELEAVWTVLESGKGSALLTPSERNWIALFKAIGRRDPRAMSKGAKAILDSRQRLPPEVLAYVVATGMVGDLVQGDRLGAYRLWLATQQALFKNHPPDLLFRLLVAECTEPG